jgi:hypothetical protein
MTIKLASLKADLKREEKGDWVAYPDWPGVEFNVSSLNLPAFAAARANEIQRLNITHKNNVPPDTMTMTIGKLLDRHILHGWKGLDVEYSPAAASEVMSDAAYRPVINAVLWCASEISQVDVKFVEDEVKNSGKPSAGA